jgi:hypothetical protein
VDPRRRIRSAVVSLLLVHGLIIRAARKGREMCLRDPAHEEDRTLAWNGCLAKWFAGRTTRTAPW